MLVKTIRSVQVTFLHIHYCQLPVSHEFCVSRTYTKGRNAQCHDSSETICIKINISWCWITHFAAIEFCFPMTIPNIIVSFSVVMSSSFTHNVKESVNNNWLSGLVKFIVPNCIACSLYNTLSNHFLKVLGLNHHISRI